MNLVECEGRRVVVLTNRPETRPEQSSRPEPSIRMQPRPDIRDAIEATRRLPERSCPPRRLTRPTWPVAIDRDRRASTPERLPSKPARRSGRASCTSRGLSLFASVASSCLPVHDRFVAEGSSAPRTSGRSLLRDAIVARVPWFRGTAPLSLGEGASPRGTPTSCGRLLLPALVLAAERIAASDPPRPAVRANEYRRCRRRDARPVSEAGARCGARNAPASRPLRE
jgi:hypothetical protein